jgi:aminomethyltransferase
MEPNAGLQSTPLAEEHVALRAKMGEFAGWAMPIEYSGVLAEHRAVREAVGMFDLTHLGKVDVEGAGAADWLQRVVTNDLSSVEVGEAQYNLILTQDGGVVDDLIVYRPEQDRYVVVPNAANTEAVLTILAQEDRPDVVVNHRPDLVTIAVQGPRSPELVTPMFPGAEALAFMECVEESYRDVVVLVARTGYTGERGFELFVSDAVAVALWRELVERGEPLGLAPCGLGARDTLRLEMGYPLHGNDISPDRSPLEAGLSWAVAFDKGPFRGRDALVRQREEGIPARLRAFRMEGKLIPRPHYEVHGGGERIGEITSGTFSPTLKVGIAMGYLSPADRWGPEERVEIEVRGRRGPARVVRPPFVDRSPK